MQWLQSAGEAFWRLQSSSMAASSELSLPPRSQIQIALLLFAFTLLRFLGGGTVKQMPSPQLGWARPCQLPSLLAAESLPGCSVQAPGTMTGSISYFKAELGTQSLLKINTKENPKVAKPILIPFFLFLALLSSPCNLGAAFHKGPTLNIVRASTHVLWMHRPILITTATESEGIEGSKGRRSNSHFFECNAK